MIKKYGMKVEESHSSFEAEMFRNFTLGGG